MITKDQERWMVHAHQLGRLDAQKGYPEGNPTWPYSPQEYEAYRAGYLGEKKRMALKGKRS
jgi:hypothetical protein